MIPETKLLVRCKYLLSRYYQKTAFLFNARSAGLQKVDCSIGEARLWGAREGGQDFAIKIWLIALWSLLETRVIDCIQLNYGFVRHCTHFTPPTKLLVSKEQLNISKGMSKHPDISKL